MPDLGKMIGDIKPPDMSKMPDITKMMGDFKMPDISKTIEDVAGKFGPDMFKPLTSGISDMFKPMGELAMPSPQEMAGNLKNSVASLGSEFGTKASNVASIGAEKENALATPTTIQGLPNQDVLAGLLEKLNTSVAGMGGLLQEGNQIAQSGNNQLASAADNRFTIG
jgi:hypothetical protein